MADAIDLKFLKQAIDVSRQAKPSPNRFCVGAVLVDINKQLIATGFTGELGDGWHAEAVAIKKAKDAGIDVIGATIYSSLEPCSTRSSGKGDCSTLLIDKEIARVVFALKEPPLFVKPEGTAKLKSAGIIVKEIAELKSDVITVNKHLLPLK